MEDFARWKEALRNGATGPLRIAQEVVAANDKWDAEKHNGTSFTSELRRALGRGRGLPFFHVRALAVDALGGLRDACMFEHNAAVWLAKAASNGKLAEAKRLSAIAFNRNLRSPLTFAQVERATRGLLGRTKVRVHTDCVGCVARDKELAELRAMVEEASEPHAKEPKAMRAM